MSTRKTLIAIAPLVGLAALVSGCATSAAAQTSLDPLTCYLDNDGPNINPDAVTLRCGGGMESEIDLTDAQPMTDPGTAPGTSIGEWGVTGASVGTSTIGTAIVRVHTEHAGDKCTYYRDLGDPADATSTDCTRL